MSKGPAALAAVLAIAFAVAGGSATAAFPGANGKLAFSKGGDIWVSNSDGSDATQLTTDPATDRKPSWSPDGTRIAFSSNRDGDFEIFVMNADGSDQRQLTFNSEPDRTSAWTPDGTRIIFDKFFDQLYVINADGSGGEEKVRDAAAFPATAPHGSKLAFTDQRDGALYTMHYDGTELSQLTDGFATGGLNPDWSPHGNNIAFICGTPGVDDNDLCSVHTDGTDLRRLTTTPTRVEFSPSWAPDGTKIAFEGCVDFLTAPDCEIYTMNPDGGDVQQLTTFGIQPGTSEVDWQPNPNG